MMNMVWVIFVPAPATWLASRGLALFRTLYGEDGEEIDLPLPEIFAGQDAYSAIGTSSFDLVDCEHSFAEALSREIDGTVYVVYPYDEIEYDEGDDMYVRRFEGGRELKPATDEWSGSLSERLRCPLPSEPPIGKVRSVWVVEGADPDRIRSAIDLEQLYLSNAVLEKIPRGTLMHRPVSGTMGLSVSEVSSALPDTTLYSVVTGPKADRFGVHIYRNGHEAGDYEATGIVHNQALALPSVLGETEPLRVCAALGVPPHLLGL